MSLRDQNVAARKIRALPAQEVTVGLWLTGWSTFFPSERGTATAVHDDYMLRPFLLKHGAKRLAEVTPLIAQEWALRNPSQLRYLRRVWEKALAMQLVTVNPWSYVELPRRQAPHRPVPTQAQLDAAVAAARDLGGWWEEFADLVEFTAFTGARLGGVSALAPSAVDLSARRVILREKGDKERRVVLAGRSLDAAASALHRAGHDKLVFRSRQRRPLTRRTVGEAWREIRGDFEGPFHSLKHFAGTWLAAQGVDERDIAVQLGHVDAMGRPYTRLVQRVYVHPDHEDALARIERAINEQEAA